MKEKTFEELLKPHQKRFDYYNSQRIYIDKADVLQLLKQVREATKAEIEDKANEYHEFATADYAHEMPEDRIRIEP